MLNKSNIISFLCLFSSNIKENSNMLSELDAKFGDGDHGITMSKIANAIDDVLKESDNLSTKEIFYSIKSKISLLAGGAAVPLWSVFFDGLSKPIENDDLSFETIKKMFASSLEELASISNAKVGDKTMMDSLIPVVEKTSTLDDGDIKNLLEISSKTAIESAENTKNYAAKFGRAKNYKEQSIGTPDCGAISMSIFFKSFYEATID